MIFYPLIEILSYQFNFLPFDYKIKIEGKLEINSQYKIGAKILSGKLTFPNQTIDLIDITPEKIEKCHNANPRCQVFKFNSFVQLSGDKYFSREFKDNVKIPFLFSLDFNAGNLESFRENNYVFQKSKFRYGHLSDYISNVKLLKIQKYWSYKNSFYIESNQRIHSLSISTSWQIKNGKQTNEYENLKIRLKNPKGPKTKTLFSVKTTGDVQVSENKIVLQNGNEINIPEEAITKKEHGGWNLYSVDGIKFPENFSGHLWSRIRVLINNHGYVINIKQNFHFDNSKEKEIIAIIVPKYDHYFNANGKWKYIYL